MIERLPLARTDGAATRVIVSYNGVHLPTTISVKAGSQIELSAKLDKSAKGPKTYRWTIPGVKFKDFNENAQCNPLISFSDEADEEWSKEKPHFYWSDEENNRIVSCNITVKGKTLSGTMSFKVLRPIVTVTASVEAGHSFYQNGLIFGTSPNYYGITFSRSSNSNTNVTGGEYCWTQVIRNGKLFASPGGPNEKFQNELDNTYTYSNNATTYDHPYFPLANYTEVIQNIDADMYLMYKPTGHDVTEEKWIPLKVVHWFANGRAYYDNVWRLSATNSYSQHPVIENVTKHPNWKAIRINAQPSSAGRSVRDE